MEHSEFTEISVETLDIVEQVVASEQHAYERTEDGELHLIAPGSWGEHQIWFAWSDRLETLHVCLSLDATAPERRRGQILELLALMNERMWLGHFDMWAEDSAVVFRHALPLPAGARPAPGQIHAMLTAAIEAGERFHPAFNLMIWGGKEPQDAVSAALFETAGEA